MEGWVRTSVEVRGRGLKRVGERRRSFGIEIFTSNTKLERDIPCILMSYLLQLQRVTIPS